MCRRISERTRPVGRNIGVDESCRTGESRDVADLKPGAMSKAEVEVVSRGGPSHRCQ